MYAHLTSDRLQQIRYTIPLYMLVIVRISFVYNIIKRKPKSVIVFWRNLPVKSLSDTQKIFTKPKT